MLHRQILIINHLKTKVLSKKTTRAIIAQYTANLLKNRSKSSCFISVIIKFCSWDSTLLSNQTKTRAFFMQSFKNRILNSELPNIVGISCCWYTQGIHSFLRQKYFSFLFSQLAFSFLGLIQFQNYLIYSNGN